MNGDETTSSDRWWPAVYPLVLDADFLMRVVVAAALGREHRAGSAVLSRAYITSNVDEEVSRHTPRRARDAGAEPTVAMRKWNDEIRPRLTVVDIAYTDVKDKLVELVVEKDPRDGSTAALAVLIAPCIVIAGDKSQLPLTRPTEIPGRVLQAEPGHRQVDDVVVASQPIAVRTVGVQAFAVGGNALGHATSAAFRWLQQRELLAPTALTVTLTAMLTLWNRERRECVGKAVGSVLREVERVQAEAARAEAECESFIVPAREHATTAERMAASIAHFPLWNTVDGLAAELGVSKAEIDEIADERWFRRNGPFVHLGQLGYAPQDDVELAG